MRRQALATMTQIELSDLIADLEDDIGHAESERDSLRALCVELVAALYAGMPRIQYGSAVTLPPEVLDNAEAALARAADAGVK
jgi:hypothetical protein